VSKVAFVFPGQGSQYIGMVKDFYDAYSDVRHIFDLASQVSGKNLTNIVFSGTEEELKQTENTQLAIYIASLSILKIINSKNIKSDIVAGHSLGEYTALTASGVLSLEQGIKLVKARGKFIKEACSKNPGGMIAILGLEVTQVEEIVKSLKNELMVEVANYNSLGQVVVSYGGSDQDSLKVIEGFTKAGAKRAIKLNVSGPFHSSLMTSASNNMEALLSQENLNEPKIPIVFNYSGELISSSSKIKEYMVKQINHSVQWINSINTMANNGVTKIVEIGPGKVLTGLIKKINKDISVYNVEKISDLDILG
jgi:[acyl-carrier-protein] S-malonyltransferase